jgi:hypothetical protein
VIEIMLILGWLISALPTLSPRPRMTLTTPSGRISAEEFRQLQRRQRRLLGRLEDDGVAAGNGRRQLPGHHHQRIVPRRDRADDADGVAADHRGVAGQVFAGDRARHRTHGAGEEAVAIDDGRDFVIEHGVDRLAAVERFERRRSLRVPFDRGRRSSGGKPERCPAWSATRRTPFRRHRQPRRSAPSEASGRFSTVSPVFGLRIGSSFSVPASKRDPISICGVHDVLPCLMSGRDGGYSLFPPPVYFRRRRSGRRRG